MDEDLLSLDEICFALLYHLAAALRQIRGAEAEGISPKAYFYITKMVKQGEDAFLESWNPSELKGILLDLNCSAGFMDPVTEHAKIACGCVGQLLNLLPANLFN